MIIKSPFRTGTGACPYTLALLCAGALALWCSCALANDEKEAFYSQAWSKFEEGKFEEAKGLFAEFKNKFADPVLSEEADYKIAECLYNLKDYPALKSHLRLLFEKYPPTPLLRFYLAEGCFYDREYPCAIENYQQALESISESYLKNSLYLGLAWSYLKLNDYPQAIAYFEKLLQNKPSEEESENALLGKAESLYGLNDYQGAVSVYQALVDSGKKTETRILGQGRIAEIYYQQNQAEKAIELYERLLNNYPDCPTCDFAYNNLGIIMFNARDYGRVIELFNLLINKYPQSPFLVHSHYYLGRAYYEKGEFLNSYLRLRDFIQKASSLDLKYEAMFLAGLSLKSLKRFQEAANIFKEIVKQSPADVSFLSKAEFESVECLYYSGDREEALKGFEFLRTKYPDSEISQLVLWRLAEHYFREDKIDLAKRYLLSLTAGPAQPLLMDQAYLLLGECYESEGKYLEAEEAFLKIRNPDPWLLTRIADNYRARNKYPEAIAYYRKGLGQDKAAQDELYFKLGECLEELNRNEEAKIEYQAISSDSRLYVNGLLRLAAIEETRDNRQGAIEIYRKISALKIKESDFAREKLEDLEEK